MTKWLPLLLGFGAGYLLGPALQTSIRQHALSGGSTGWNPNFGYWRPIGQYSIGRLGGGFASMPHNLLPFGVYPWDTQESIFGPKRPPLL